MFALLIVCAVAYDYNMLVLDWRPAQCLDRKCRQGYVENSFNIHGLWPKNSDGSWPEYCSDKPISITADTELYLLSYWNSYSKSIRKFWEHEWLKHGTCFTPELDSEKYFQLAIAMYLGGEVLEKLVQNDIVPSNYSSYSPEMVRSVFEKKPSLDCKNIGSGNYLRTIIFCFDLELNWIDCPKSKFKCDSSFYIPKLE